MKTLEYIPITSPRYWRAACGELRNLHALVFAALIAAITVVISNFRIPVTESLNIYFKFIATALGCAVYGPVMGLFVGIVTDTIGYVIHPFGPYFPGYMVSEMVGGMVYGLLLYRKRITVLRLLGAKFFVNYGVNVLLGSLWSSILYGKGYLFYAAKSLVKNSILLPFEVVVLVALFTLLIPQLERRSAIAPRPAGQKRIVPFL